MKRALSLSAIVSIIFFNVCGGAYAVEDILAAGPGFAVLLILVAPLIWSVPIALICAELGTAIPEEGGYYAWSRAPWGHSARSVRDGGRGCIRSSTSVSIPRCSVTIWHTSPEFGTEGHFWLRKGLMIGMIWTFVLLNLFGSRMIGNFAKLFFVLVMSPFVVLVLIGLYQGLTRGFTFSPVTPLLSPGKTLGPAMATAIPLVLWNYMGWDSISTIAGEMTQPRRDYPRALLISVVLISGVYVAPPLVALALLGTENFHWTSGAWSALPIKSSDRGSANSPVRWEWSPPSGCMRRSCWFTAACRS